MTTILQVVFFFIVSASFIVGTDNQESLRKLMNLCNSLINTMAVDWHYNYVL